MIAVCVGIALIATLEAQRPPVADAVSPFVSVDAPVVALTNARVIDGTGAAAREQQTLILRNGRIEAVGDSSRTPAPADARIIDLAAKSVIPGLVMLHEHLYYPVGPGVFGQLGQSFVRLYLAGGVTTIRTGGNMNGFMDLNLKRGVDEGRVAGPAMDAMAPYVNGANTFLQMRSMADADEARRQVAYWADMGATSVKAYMQISRPQLGAVVAEAHARKLKVTGHLHERLEGRLLEPARAVELLVDAGFTPLEAITIATRNGARYLGREHTIGTIAVGKQADLVVLDGVPSRAIADIRRVNTVYRAGIGYDPARLIASVAGKAGLW